MDQQNVQCHILAIFGPFWALSGTPGPKLVTLVTDDDDEDGEDALNLSHTATL